ncbi:MAG: sigma factor-like helix-turn-helix DNA-binding protein [Aminobacterium sp.]|jgi:predicted DNA-binding protein YlxM (UPF0122 family)|uniref:Uncharacterized protein n=1 Tax=bioreactor metagenome TaxID=1076179 RepID=A0A645D628_9ZZZZ|nr:MULTISPECIES: sigma factor-like helix-turn-helix DNA-binding protein [unclassified Aminobacterium]MDD2206748.1 sigma factor-like helix-turn-helix DNA-binding protein [Aminobacterium sp.]MDD3425988.1 sigma factor-like helix-turn-helix DNA-binding protein [Aminobacterium sp.]MDD3707792.1 sigma factor-like helix-turn-helix DNA-binding protein [Aminobacterium sp.]MDD4229527.1 sigma factor-like helix-turn-helix DNA-binding protein [Aminobacterium sp.]MDD4552070.1 sigma factor-like helix-turn-hel
MNEENLLKERLYLNELYDLYGPLLTEKQRNAYEYHEFSDLSISEIAERLNTSRQAVFDLITRAKSRLEELEELLKLHARITNLEKQIENLEKSL